MKWFLLSIAVFVGSIVLFAAIPRSALIWARNLVVQPLEVTDDSRTASGVVVASETIARQGDGQSYDPAFEDPLHAGVEFRVLEERPGWHRVELPDGRRCWLPDRDIQLLR